MSDIILIELTFEACSVFNISPSFNEDSHFLIREGKICAIATSFLAAEDPASKYARLNGWMRAFSSALKIDLRGSNDMTSGVEVVWPLQFHFI